MFSAQGIDISVNDGACWGKIEGKDRRVLEKDRGGNRGVEEKEKSQKMGIVQKAKSHAGSEYEDFLNGQISIYPEKFIKFCILTESEKAIQY